jgi:hypothetical protein
MKVPDVALRLLSHRYGATLLVLLAVLALYGAAVFSRPSGTARAQVGGQTPVQAAVVACPAPGGARLSALSFPSLGGITKAAPGKALPAKGGRVDLTQTQGGTSVGSFTAPGTAWSQDVQTATGSYTLRAAGTLAEGLEAEQTTLEKKGDDRGLSAVRCTDPGTDLWFLGPGPSDAEHLDLYLTNVDDQTAAVDASALTDDGPLDTTDGRGLIVEPHTTRVVPIGTSPEGLGVIEARLLGLRVQVTTGRVAAAVRVRVGKGKGVDWLPVTAPPAAQLVVPGIPSGSGRRQLLIAVPGDGDARIKIQVITSAGAFAPQGQDILDAPARTVTPLDLERALSGKAAAVRLVADRPILAGFTVQQGDDVAYGAATPPLGGSGSGSGSGGAVADNRDVSSVLLTAPDGPATVKLVTLTAQGAAGSPYVAKIEGTRTLEVRLAAPTGTTDGFGVVIVPQPGSGPVYASRVFTSDKLITIVPVMPAPTTVQLPPVADSLTSLIP